MLKPIDLVAGFLDYLDTQQKGLLFESFDLVAVSRSHQIEENNP